MSQNLDISEIEFDEQDENLFQVPDPYLRAKALRHSVLPRMHGLLNEAIAVVQDIYDVAVLNDSIVSFFPHFRPQRNTDLEHLYDAAFVGLGGKRKKVWPGFERKNGKPVQILPFRLGFEITDQGLGLVLENGWLTGLSKASYEKLFQFHLRYEALINALSFQAGMMPVVTIDSKSPALIAPLRDHYQYMLANKHFDNHFVQHRYFPYPVKADHLWQAMMSFVYFFPVYDAYLQIAKGEPERFVELVSRLNHRLSQSEVEESEVEDNEIDERVMQNATEAAAAKVRVMPSLRWQVFQRDQWRCVACGLSSHHDVILHVDHIIPRSKGGSDNIDNLQTLCQICNSGKSNRDSTDLRQPLGHD